jgi:hypothetical protein
MARLQPAKVKWKSLNLVLNKMIDAINMAQPLNGAGINVHPSAGGTSISLQTLTKSTDPKSDSTVQPEQNSGGSGPEGGGWVTIQIMDTETCTTTSLEVWAKTGGGAGL